MRTYLLIVIILFSRLAIAESSHSIQTPTPAKSSSQLKTNPSIQDTKTLTKDIKIISLLNLKEEHQEETKNEKNDYFSSEWWLVYITGVLSLITGFLAWFTSNLWKATKKSIDDSRETAERQLRAYVFVAGVEITNVGTNDIQAVITIRNTGKTPAYKVTISTKARAFNIQDDIVLEDTPVGSDSSRFVFGPDGLGQRNIPLRDIFTCSEAITTIREGGGILYIYGKILYEDAFKKNQSTQFNFNIGGTNGWPNDNKMFVSPEGNEAT
jgi:hypothetical protein